MSVTLPAIKESTSFQENEELARRALQRWWRPASSLTVDQVGKVFWPIALAESLGVGQGRHQWKERAFGAVDLVSQRTGLLEAWPEIVPQGVAAEDHVIVARIRREAAEMFWREYHRGRLLRRYRPWTMPKISHVGFQRVYVVHHLVRVQDRLLLVDPMSRHAEDLDNFPWVRDQVRAGRPSPLPTA